MDEQASWAKSSYLVKSNANTFLRVLVNDRNSNQTNALVEFNDIRTQIFGGNPSIEFEKWWSFQIFKGQYVFIV